MGDNSIRSPLADRLRALRLAHDWTQAEVAVRLDIHRSTYSYYEQGHTQPGFSTLVAMAKLFGVSTDYLLGAEPPDVDIELQFIDYYLGLPVEDRQRVIDRLIHLIRK